MTLLATRIIALMALFGLTMLAGIGPVLLFRLWARRKKATILDVSGERRQSSGSIRATKSTASAVTLQLFMFFGGGVLLATCFVHLIPEVRQNFDNYFDSLESSTRHGSHDSHDHSHGAEHDMSVDHDHDLEHPHHHHHHDHDNESNISYDDVNGTSSVEGYDGTELAEVSTGHNHQHKVPYVELAICGGFFLIYFIEELIHLIIGHNHHGPDDSHDGHMVDKQATGTAAHDCESIQTSRTTIREDGQLKDSPMHRSSSPAHLVACSKRAEHYGTICYDNHAVDLKEDQIYPEFRPTPIEAFGDRGNISPTSSYDMLKAPTDGLTYSVRFLRGFVTIIAFSAHSIFDGVAIGLQKTPSQLWAIFFAISMHKLVVAFAIGLELYEQTASFVLTCIHMVLFSIMSPIGIILVILTENEFSEDDSPVIILLSAVATGTILYIVFFEILQRDRCSKVPGLVQLLVLVIGFAVMTCVTLFIDH